MAADDWSYQDAVDWFTWPTKDDEHKPCGHWHKREHNVYYTSITGDFWQAAIDINNTKVAFGAPENSGEETISLDEFDLAENRWYFSSQRTVFRVEAVPGTVRIVDNFAGYYFWDDRSVSTYLHYHYNGEVFGKAIFTAPTEGKDLTYTYNPEVYKGFDVNNSGLVVAIASSYGDGRYIVSRVSLNFGETWNDSKLVSFDGSWSSTGLTCVIDSAGVIWIGAVSGNDLYVFKSDNSGETYEQFGSISLVNVSWVDLEVTSDYVYVTAVDFDGSDKLQLYRSAKDSSSFSKVYEVVSNVKHRLAAHENYVWLANRDTGDVIRSTDSGSTFSTCLDVSSISGISFTIPNYNRLRNDREKLVYTSCGAYNDDDELIFLYSPNAGDTWKVIASLKSVVNESSYLASYFLGEHGAYTWETTGAGWNASKFDDNPVWDFNEQPDKY